MQLQKRKTMRISEHKSKKLSSRLQEGEIKTLHYSPSMNKLGQKQFMKLVDEGINEKVALKITNQSSYQSEIMQCLNKMIEGINKYRNDFQSSRSPKFEVPMEKLKKVTSKENEQTFDIESKMQFHNMDSSIEIDSQIQELSTYHKRRQQKNKINLKLSNLRGESIIENDNTILNQEISQRKPSTIFSDFVFDNRSNNINLHLNDKDRVLFASYGESN